MAFIECFRIFKHIVLVQQHAEFILPNLLSVLKHRVHNLPVTRGQTGKLAVSFQVVNILKLLKAKEPKTVINYKKNERINEREQVSAHLRLDYK